MNGFYNWVADTLSDFPFGSLVSILLWLGTIAGFGASFFLGGNWTEWFMLVLLARVLVSVEQTRQEVRDNG